MAKFHLTKKAVGDLENIWNYTYNKWSERQADRYYLMLIETCQEIANEPKIGRNYENVTPNLKGYNAGKHIIFYRQMSVEIIEITRILHGQMDLSNRIQE